jgi:hypothetical protein
MIEVRSPKLGRLVQHYDHASFQQWVCLEADPGVCAFCERPARIGPDPTSQLINYWVSRKQTQEFVMLMPLIYVPIAGATTAICQPISCIAFP